MSLTPDEYAHSPLAGGDISWLAVDRDGHVAWLVTFGSAVVPAWIEEQARASQDKGFDLLDDVDAMVSSLQEQGGLALRSAKPSEEQWRSAARRGLFAFDWVVYTGPYRAVAAPDAPILVDALPSPVAALAKRSCFPHVCFRECAVITLSDVQQCV